MTILNTTVRAVVLRRLVPAIVAMSTAGSLLAQPAALDFVASPETYTVIAQDDRNVVVEGVWKPGQRDAFHSHPTMLFYWLTNCDMRWHFPDGTTQDVTVAAGQAGSMAAIESHSVQNRGSSECRIIMFEPSPAR